ncbi:MAG: hypothetical protein ACLFU9_07200 [Candidatus Bathyarchaeia archaeon]
MSKLKESEKKRLEKIMRGDALLDKSPEEKELTGRVCKGEKRCASGPPHFSTLLTFIERI